MTMQLKHVALACICLTSFVLVFQVSLKSDLPLSWDVWYHLRISRQFSEGEFVWDSGSFGPEGRPHSYPPLFHGVNFHSKETRETGIDVSGHLNHNRDFP